MKLFEIEEAMTIIKDINSLLLIFSTTKKSNALIVEYLQTLILELQNQEMLEEVAVETGEEINFSRQIDFLKYMISILEDGVEEEIIKLDFVDKTVN